MSGGVLASLVSGIADVLDAVERADGLGVYCAGSSGAGMTSGSSSVLAGVTGFFGVKVRVTTGLLVI